VQQRLEAISPEPVRGFTTPLAMGGGTGGAFASAFMEYIKTRGAGLEVIASFGIIPEFGWDPVIYGPACVSIVMNLAYQLKHADAPVLIDNRALRTYAARFQDKLAGRSSIVDELPKELEVGWREYRNMNMIAAHAVAAFLSSFTRETEWDMSNYRTWLAASKPKFVIPWLIPLVPEHGSEIKNIQEALKKGEDGVLFDLGELEGRQIKAGKKDSACVIVKVKGILGEEDRNLLRSLIKERFPMDDKRIIFIRVPCMAREPATACILLNVKALSEKIMPIVKDAEETWEDYKGEYERWGLKQEEFKQSLINVVDHFS